MLVRLWQWLTQPRPPKKCEHYDLRWQCHVDADGVLHVWLWCIKCLTPIIKHRLERDY